MFRHNLTESDTVTAVLPFPFLGSRVVPSSPCLQIAGLRDAREAFEGRRAAFSAPAWIGIAGAQRVARTDPYGGLCSAFDGRPGVWIRASKGKAASPDTLDLVLASARVGGVQRGEVTV